MNLRFCRNKKENYTEVKSSESKVLIVLARPTAKE